MFNGCGGNNNRFDTIQQCREQCNNVNPSAKSASGGHSMVLSVRMFFDRYYFNMTYHIYSKM